MEVGLGVEGFDAGPSGSPSELGGDCDAKRRGMCGTVRVSMLFVLCVFVLGCKPLGKGELGKHFTAREGIMG
jgi:hypothetical protein